MISGLGVSTNLPMELIVWLKEQRQNKEKADADCCSVKNFRAEAILTDTENSGNVKAVARALERMVIYSESTRQRMRGVWGTEKEKGDRL